MYRIKEVTNALSQWAGRSKQRKEFKMGLFDDLKNMFENYVTPIKTRKFKIGKVSVLLTEESKTPLIIRQVYFPTLTSLILDILGSIEELQAFEKVQIRYVDRGILNTNPYEWFRRMFLSWRREICASKSIAYVKSEEEEIIINVEADSILGLISLDMVFPGMNLEQVCKSPGEIRMSSDEVMDKINKIVEKIKSPTGLAKLNELLKPMLLHELTHEIHKKRQPGVFEGKDWTKVAIKTGLIDKTLRGEVRTAREQLTFILLRLRSSLANFHYKLLAEGMAVYAAEKPAKYLKEWESRQDAWQKFMPEFKKSYYSLLDSAKKVIDNFDRYSEEEKKQQIYSLDKQTNFFCDKMNDFTYYIGLHMIQTLSFFPVDVFNLNLNQFYKLYEDVCIDKLNRKPLISAGSNSGLIDIIKISEDEEALLKYFINIETGELIEKPIEKPKTQKITSS